MQKKTIQSNGREAEDGVENLQAGNSNRHLPKLDTIFENFPTAIVITDNAGHISDYNRAAEAILGKIPADLSPEDWPKRFGLYLDDGKTYYPGKNTPLVRALQGESIEAEAMIHLDGSTPDGQWISMSARPLTTENGQVDGALVDFSDITSRKRVEISRAKKARRAEVLYTLSQQVAEAGNNPTEILNTVVVQAAELIGDACVAAMISPSGDRLRVVSFHHAKPTAQALLRESVISKEYDPKDMIVGVVRSGEPLLIPTLDQARLVSMALPEHTHYIQEIGVQSLLVVPIKGRNEVLGTLGLTRDRGGSSYTADDQSFLLDMAYRAGLAIDNFSLVDSLRLESHGRQVAEKALAQSEVRFRSIFAATTLGIKLLDLEGNILETNSAFQHMLGYKESELKGSHISRFLHPADVKRALQLLDNLKNYQGHGFRLEHRLLSKSGLTVWVNAAFTGIKKSDRDEKLAFIVAIAENITERKRMEAEMAEMKKRLNSHVEIERLQLAQELHDGPLQDLYGALYKIEEWGDKVDHGSKEKFNDLKLALMKVIHELRTTTKGLRPPVVAFFGLEKAIRSHAEEFNENHPELALHLDLAEDGQVMPEDIRLILFRIYQHSLANVLRHSQATQVQVRFSLDAEEARLEIRDNGIGFVVPDNWVELTRQGHYGLAGTVERVSLLEGTFTVESTPGAGTTVKVAIPIKDRVDTAGVERQVA